MTAFLEAQLSAYRGSFCLPLETEFPRMIPPSF